jgi:hypothetical protein
MKSEERVITVVKCGIEPASDRDDRVSVEFSPSELFALQSLFREQSIKAKSYDGQTKMRELYVNLQREKEALEQERAEDQEILNAKLTMEKVAAKISVLERPYNDQISEITEDIEKDHERLIEGWDIPDKTYVCGMGTATLKTTKSLKISDKKRLIAVLLKIDTLEEAIRSWKLSYLRNLKDVDMIEDSIAFYEEHQNVVIKGVTNE